MGICFSSTSGSRSHDVSHAGRTEESSQATPPASHSPLRQRQASQLGDSLQSLRQAGHLNRAERASVAGRDGNGISAFTHGRLVDLQERTATAQRNAGVVRTIYANSQIHAPESAAWATLNQIGELELEWQDMHESIRQEPDTLDVAGRHPSLRRVPSEGR
jgi:hypothetical protein